MLNQIDLRTFERLRVCSECAFPTLTRSVVLLPRRMTLRDRIRLWWAELRKEPLPLAGPIHCSGYRLFELVLIGGQFEPQCRTPFAADTLYFEGVAGLGFNFWLKRHEQAPVQDWVRSLKEPNHPAWRLDVLGKSGLVRLFTDTGWIFIDGSSGSVELFAVIPPEEAEELADLHDDCS